MALLCLSLMSYGINLGSNFGITTISHAKKSGALFYMTERKTHPSERGWDVSDH